MSNLHNHTTYSDGDLSPERIIELSIGYGLEAVAITDHLQTSKCPSLRLSKLEAYIKKGAMMKDRFKNDIDVYWGIEIDSIRSHSPYIDEFFPDRLIDMLDLVLFEYVEEYVIDSWSLEDLIAVRDEIRPMVGLAHPDLNWIHRKKGAEGLARLLVENRIFFELNSSYHHNWRAHRGLLTALREQGVVISIGTDTHYRDEDIEDLRLVDTIINELEMENLLLSEVLKARQRED